MFNTGRSGSRVFRQKKLQTCLRVRSTGSCKINVVFLFSAPPLRKILNTAEKVEELSLVDRGFAPGDSPRPVKTKMAMPPYPNDHGGHFRYQIFTLWLDIASGSIRGGHNLVFIFVLEPACTESYYKAYYLMCKVFRRSTNTTILGDSL